VNSLQHYEHRERRHFAPEGSAYYDSAARSAAFSLYAEAQQRGWWQRLWRWLHRLPRHLRSLEAIDPATVIGRYELVRVQAVPIDQIVGSAGRAYDFDRAFYPLRAHTRDRWISVADLWYRGVGLPPVNLVKVGDEYFVIDGHHRISVARVFGAAAIAAVVTVWHVAEARAVGQPATQLCPALPGQSGSVEEL
jgi:hypothetical protein